MRRKKIIGVTVGSPLPKPNLKQTDPKKGDYVKGKDVIPTKVSDLENDLNFLTEHQDLSGYAKRDEIPTKADQVGADPKGTANTAVYQHDTNTEAHNDIRLALKAINDRLTAFFDSDDKTLDELSEIVAYITSNKTLIESITTNKVGVSDIVDNLATNVKNKPLSAAQGVVLKGLIDTISGSLSNYQPKGEYALASEIPTKVSDLENDSKFITASGAPVQSVNGKTGAVTLDAAAVGARPGTWMPTHSDVGAEKSGTASSEVGKHNTNTDAHNDIRLLIDSLATRLDALANSDDETLDQMAEVVAYIKSNRNLIEQITTGKVSVSDIVNNLSTNVTDKPLSAAQGVALKALIDAITIPTKLSEFANDKGFITGYTETDPTVPSWAKAETKPSYSKSEVGLGNVDNVKQYSASNPPPYPVASVNGKTGAVTLDAAAVGADPKGTANTAAATHNTAADAHNDLRILIDGLTSRLNALANSTEEDLDQMAELVSYIKENRELISGITTDKVNVKDIINNLTTNVSNKPLSAAQGVALKALIDAVPEWAKAANKPSYKASEVGARANTWTPSSADIQSALGYRPASQSATIAITGKDADGNTHTFTVVGWEGGGNEPT